MKPVTPVGPKSWSPDFPLVHVVNLDGRETAASFLFIGSSISELNVSFHIGLNNLIIILKGDLFDKSCIF